MRRERPTLPPRFTGDDASAPVPPGSEGDAGLGDRPRFGSRLPVPGTSTAVDALADLLRDLGYDPVYERDGLHVHAPDYCGRVVILYDTSAKKRGGWKCRAIHRDWVLTWRCEITHYRELVGLLTLALKRSVPRTEQQLEEEEHDG